MTANIIQRETKWGKISCKIKIEAISLFFSKFDSFSLLIKFAYKNLLNVYV